MILKKIVFVTYFWILNFQRKGQSTMFLTEKHEEIVI